MPDNATGREVDPGRWEWTLLDDVPPGDEWSHAGIDADAHGNVYWTDPAGGQVLRRNLASGHVEAIPVPLLEVHDIVYTTIRGAEELWLADPGFKARPPLYESVMGRGRAGILSLADRSFTEIPAPSIDAYIEETWRPTSIAVASDAVVVADGYGAWLVHIFTPDGSVITMDSGAHGGRFQCPHGVIIVPGAQADELVIADRGNRRLVVTDLGGRLLRIIEHPLLRSPTGLALRGERLLVTDLDGALLEVDLASGDVEALVPFPDREKDPGWPNRTENGQSVRPQLEDGRLNSPHGVVALADGSICLTEWLIGGRELRLIPRAAR